LFLSIIFLFIFFVCFFLTFSSFFVFDSYSTAAVIGADGDGVVCLSDADAIGEHSLELTFGAFDLDGHTADLHRDLLGDGDRIFADT
jgi:hypothetical protein